jgi:hypothetical protein
MEDSWWSRSTAARLVVEQEHSCKTRGGTGAQLQDSWWNRSTAARKQAGAGLTIGAVAGGRFDGGRAGLEGRRGTVRRSRWVE